MLKAAIFDFDGTLFGSNYVWITAGERFFQSAAIPSYLKMHSMQSRQQKQMAF